MSSLGSTVELGPFSSSTLLTRFPAAPGWRRGRRPPCSSSSAWRARAALLQQETTR